MFRKSPDADSLSTSDVQSQRQKIFTLSVHTSHCYGHNIL